LFQWTSTYHTITAKYQGNYRVRPFILACARARTRRSLGSYTSVVCLHSLSSLALLFLSVALSYLDFHKHFLVLDAIFFLTKGIPSSHLAIDSFTNTHPKISLTQNHLGILAALLIVVAIFWTILSSFSLFFLAPLFFSITILTTKICSIYLQFQRVCSYPQQLIPDTMAYMLSISFQLRHDWAPIAIFHRSPADKSSTPLPFLKMIWILMPWWWCLSSNSPPYKIAFVSIHKISFIHKCILSFFFPLPALRTHVFYIAQQKNTDIWFIRDYPNKNRDKTNMTWRVQVILLS